MEVICVNENYESGDLLMEYQAKYGRKNVEPFHDIKLLKYEIVLQCITNKLRASIFFWSIHYPILIIKIKLCNSSV